MFQCPNAAGHSHGDRNKSFNVKTINGRQRWRCYGNCRPLIGSRDAGGDALDFVMWHYGYDTAEAIRYLRTRDGSAPLPGRTVRRTTPSPTVGTTGTTGAASKAPREQRTPPAPTGNTVAADIEADYLGRYCGWRGWPLEVAKRYGVHVVQVHGRYYARHPFYVPTLTGPVMFGWQDRALYKPARAKWLAPPAWPLPLWGVESFTTATVPVVVICEGPADGLTAAYALEDYADGWRPTVVAVPGVATWRPDWTALFEGAHVVTAGDPDNAGEELNARLAKDLGPVAASVHRANRDLLTTDLTGALQAYGRHYVAAALMAPLEADGVTP
jgi:hypothetical protein